ncbi:DNA recombination protein RmuC [Stappia sp. F7233]|uniref:DNA recombination protein RmuC homolog n=1 Tax=Stappia albiluteola TaxID=2758565 RepID=A0A839A9Y3_9HYPH|nr:DNA recombination protein RmuC [Stappia albiluteola]MBA5776221.1 DNA recombination protein RmuC [Stappia albiluteola]
MQTILFYIGEIPVTVFRAGVAFGGIAFFMLATLFIAMLRQSSARANAEAAAASQTAEMESRLSELLRVQAEMTGRMQTMAEVFGSRQSDMMRSVNERLDGMGHKLGQTMADTTKNTHEGLRQLHERLAVIDRAQRNITDLSGQVVELQSILSNKQTRGAFGQGRMETIIRDALPSNAYSFQATLSNNNRPDCLVTMPNGTPPLVIDAKFPLEAYNLIRNAKLAEEAKQAQAQFRRDVTKHIQDIKERYFISGETQDTAFLFVPSESVFAEIHENFEDIVQKAHRLRVVLVSPSLLMLSIQVIQALLKDARMREQAHLIQAEVGRLAEDVNRLDDRVRKLQSHFSRTARDIDDILISTDKIVKRGRNIGELDLGEEIEAKTARSGSLQAADKPYLAPRPEQARIVE